MKKSATEVYQKALMTLDVDKPDHLEIIIDLLHLAKSDQADKPSPTPPAKPKPHISKSGQVMLFPEAKTDRRSGPKPFYTREMVAEALSKSFSLQEAAGRIGCGGGNLHKLIDRFDLHDIADPLRKRARHIPTDEFVRLVASCRNIRELMVATGYKQSANIYQRAREYGIKLPWM